MSDERPLPEDLDRWPEDPWALFGLPRETNRRDVKRAYARLIRFYKPEHYPNEFARIRSAYEFLDSFLEFREAGIDIAPAPVSSEEGAAAPAPSDALPPETAPPETLPPPVPPVEVSPRDKLWQRAQAGELEAAYAGYLQMLEEGDVDDEIYARLYWLLSLWPHVEDWRRATDWLVKGLEQTKLGGRLLELYRREVLRDPNEALMPRFWNLLSVEAPLGRYADLLAMRWQAAAMLERFDVMREDLDWARQHIAVRDSISWARLLTAAIDYLAWHEERESQFASGACRRELESAEFDHNAIAGDLDRCDFLAKLVESWRKLYHGVTLPGNFVRPLCALVRDSWLLPFAAVRFRLMDFLAQSLVEPATTIDLLDRARNIGPLVVYHLANLVQALYNERCDRENEPDPKKTAAGIGDFFGHSPLGNYENLRPYLLGYCLGQRLTAEQFAAGAKEALTPYALESSGVLQFIERDVALQILCRAALTLWP